VKKLFAQVLLPLYMVASLSPLAVLAQTATQTAPAQESVRYEAANPTHPRLALKYDTHFLVLDLDGMIHSGPAQAFGLYNDDTRYLNRWEWTINGAKPTLLYKDLSDGYAGTFIYGNPTLPDIPEQTVMFKRELLVTESGARELITLKNFGTKKIDNLNLRVSFDADFADLFEVRGANRKQRGKPYVHIGVPTAEAGSDLTFGYKGLDGVTMVTTIDGIQPPGTLKDLNSWLISLDPQEELSFDVVIITESDINSSQTDPHDFLEEKRSLDHAYKDWRANGATVKCSDPLTNKVLERGLNDLFMLRQKTPKGYCLAAGIPWFACAFGRDQCVTGLQTVAFLPSLSREMIGVLAAYQGTKVDPYTEEQPGRIMHELRLGEMARLREIPFVPYYGTIDATPLWLMLFAEYIDWTGDVEFARSQWNHVKSALAYLESTTSGDHFLRYGGKPNAALSNQGWKDSGDSVMYSDGTQVKPSVALCEPQGYLYSALRRLGPLANKLNDKATAARVTTWAEKLKAAFQSKFWMLDKNFVALALDGDGRQCDVISSNPGHLLGTGILTESQEKAVASKLLEPDMFCGWGIRTLSAKELAYNPMSYHNGSVWPHDNSLACAGMGTMHDTTKIHTVMKALLDVAASQPENRLPELFSGFPREGTDVPVSYPVSCVPQAWAAGSMLMMLTSCLGLQPDPANHKLRVNQPNIPNWLGTVEISNLKVGTGSADLKFENKEGKTVCTVSSANGLQVEVVPTSVSSSLKPQQELRSTALKPAAAAR
jgi:glycogen debranching enzyme